MRLTLRTLLAWLDDTLPASEVRQIGKQVAESPFAQELVDRTYRVTRQRRLGVPSSNGAEGTDANLVAAYLDNELSPDEVADYEKKCLTTDVNLAEVASAHQILSLIGQKAKVPPESRHRMYRLVRGREAAVNASAKTFRTVPVVEDAPAEPDPWTPPSAARRPIGERLGIASLVAVLLAVIGWTAYTSLRPEAGSDANRPNFRPHLAKNDLSAPPVAENPNTVAKPAVPEPVAKVASAAPKETMPEAAKPEGESKPIATHAITLVAGDGVVMGWNNDKTEWSRLTAATPIKVETRLLNLAPFWSTFESNTARVVLVDEVETTISAAGRESGVSLGLIHGRAILKGGEPGVPFKLIVAGRTIKVGNAPGTAIGLERTWSLSAGPDPVPTASLMIYVPEGEASLEVGEVKQSVTGPAIVSMTDKGEPKLLEAKRIPAWVKGPGPSPAEKQLGDRFLKFFSPTGSVLRDLVQAVDGDDQDVRRLAIRGLGAVGDAEMIVPVLNNASTDAATRRAAADVLRSMLARGGATALGVQSELKNVFGAELSGDMEKMLLGFTADDEKQEATLGELTRLLSSPELGTRELAIQSLMTITKRDNLEYDPLKPDVKVIKAWQELLRKREQGKAATPSAKAATPPAKAATPPTSAR